jgi:predicted ATPase
MITRVEIDGFKTFQNFALDLEPLTIIAGPNSAGKSNLFDGLQLLSRLSETGLTAAFQNGRGRIRDQFSWFRGEPGRFLKLAVELLLADQGNGHERLEQTRLRYEVLIERKQELHAMETLLVAGEQLTAIAKDSDTWIAAHPEFDSFAKYGSEQAMLGGGLLNLGLDAGPDIQRSYNGPGAVIRDGGTMAFSKDLRESTVLSSHGAAGGRHVAAVRRELLSWRFPVVDVAKLRNPSEPGSEKVLALDGSNLPTVLAALPKGVGAAIQVDLADLVTGVRGFEVALPSGEQLCVEVLFTDGEKVPARILSDGTLRILAFLTLLRSAHPGAVIAHEEPETGIYPGRLTALLDKLISATEPAGGILPVQVVLNTHSPVVLSILRQRPSAVVLADKVSRTEQGTVRRFTRMRHVALGESADRGATLASRREAERLLEVAKVDERP